ncbi:hypothetical protein [Clostridium sp. LIBA-8841]|uniref:hypothetical protein n=1 Tax=Clostridium sp. LIBA-8841 TaxID=2987530 RepID=UPI002AC5EBAF|nr:hypothetical protein [Clostridium sp. LIBA-8841]MDZ5252466.1 hypothetical protein [Clostridium sp. LIBA-8841]
MRKKLGVVFVLTFILSLLVACGGKSLIDQGKEEIKKGNYEEATAIFKAASEEDSKDKDVAESLYELTYNYVIASKAYDEFKLDVALESLNKVEENKNADLIKEDISKLNEEISKDKNAIDNFNLNMDKVTALENEGSIVEAKELLSTSIEEVSYLGDNAKELIDSGNSKMKVLDEKIEKNEEKNKEIAEKNKKAKEEKEKALEVVKNLGVVKKDQYLELKSNEVYDLGDGSYGFIINKFYAPEGKPEPALISQYLVDKESWKVKEVKDGITTNIN